MTRYRFDQITENSTAKKRPEDSDRDRYVGLEHLDPGTLEVTRWGAEVTPKGDKLLMKKGDVLFGRRRAYQKKVGIAPFDGIFSAHGMVLRPKTDVVDPTFFPFFISSDMFLDEAIRVSVGSLSPTANWKDLRTLEFNLPSLGKQRELAVILSEAEQLKGHYRRLLVACDDVVKSQFVEMFGDPSVNPKTFKTAGLLELGNAKNGLNYHSKDTGYKVPCLGVADFGDLWAIEGGSTLGKISLNERPSKEYCLEDGDIVFVRSNGNKELVGRCLAVYPGKSEVVFSGFCIRVRLNDNRVRVPYLLALLKQDSVRRRLFGRGANVQNLNQKLLSKIDVPLPPLELQQEFADFAASVDKSKFAVQKALDELNATTKKILNQELGLGDV